MDSKLKDARNDNDKKQVEIAKILNVRQEQYSRWERKPSIMPIEVYMELAKYYNLSIDYLCGLIKIPKKLTQYTNSLISISTTSKNYITIVSENNQRTYAVDDDIFEIISKLCELQKERKKT